MWTPTLLKAPKGVALIMSSYLRSFPNTSTVARFAPWTEGSHILHWEQQSRESDRGRCCNAIDAVDVGVGAGGFCGASVIAGQMCVAPDYILVNWTKPDDLVDGLKRAYKTFFPHGVLDDLESYGNIMNVMHFDWLCSLLDRAKGEIIMEGRRDASWRRIEPPMDSLLENVEFVNTCPRLLYASTEDPIAKQLDWHSSRAKLLKIDTDQTQSSALVSNDTVQQLAGWNCRWLRLSLAVRAPVATEVPAVPYEDMTGAISSRVHVTIPTSLLNGKPPHAKSRANGTSMMDGDARWVLADEYVKLLP
ncbi:hypothetical protein F5I97DRAFT_1832638 [Phlebopus sp. FC_14]|nr:hypothetical protein F5I97DRAFT_1832638 [Phlebopus sp. FC_14]